MKIVSNVVVLPVMTSIDIEAERVLEGAINAKLQSCFVAGYDENGDTYFASSLADGGDVLWLMEKAKAMLMKITE